MYGRNNNSSGEYQPPTRWVLLIGIVVCSAFDLPAGGPPEEGLLKGLRMSESTDVVTDFNQVVRAWAASRQEAWNPATGDTDDEEKRDASGAYAKVAQAVVVVRTQSSHGTGFVIDADGWIITNHHVIVPASIDPSRGIQVVTLYRGQLKDGFMRLEPEGIRAHVYRQDPQRDLALLKVADKFDETERLPTLPLAERAPPPGTQCMVIGHPAAATLWTLRVGIVSSAGYWPKDMIDYVMAKLALTETSQQKRLESLIANQPRRKVLISSCAVNPGDSGGPLVDMNGRVIAVTFAMPGGNADGAASAAKFAYHIHLDELRQFVKDFPEQPDLFVPDPLPPATMVAVNDLDTDGVPDTLVYGMDADAPPTGICLDLDHDSAAEVAQAVKQGAKREDVGLWQRLWDYEFSFYVQPEPRAFYDTDDDGRIDTILVDSDEDGQADAQLRLVNGKWKHTIPRNQRVFDAQLFTDASQRKRFLAIIAAVSSSE